MPFWIINLTKEVCEKLKFNETLNNFFYEKNPYHKLFLGFNEKIENKKIEILLLEELWDLKFYSS